MRFPRVRLPLVPLRAYPYLLPPVAVVLLWLPGVNQGAWRVDTGLYAAIALRAYETGDLWNLHTGDLPYFNKPPLAFWIHGLFLWIFGPHLWVARLPSLLAAIGGLIATMRLVHTLSGPRVAIASGLVLATTLEYFRFTAAISLDLWLTFLLMASLALVATGVRRDRPSHVLASGVPLGLALLVKPMIALLGPVCVGIWLIWIGRRRLLGWLGASVIIALAIAAPWHIAMTAHYGDQFVSTYFIGQAVNRVTGNGFTGEPIYYYLKLLPEFYWPWLLTFAASIAIWIRCGGLDLRPERRQLEKLALIWTAIWLLAFTLAADKHSRYMIVVYPMLAVLTGIVLATRLRRPGRICFRFAERWMLPSGLVLIGLVIALGLGFHHQPTKKWIDTRAFVTRQNLPTLWADSSPGIKWSSANMYLYTGAWPRTVHIEDELARQAGLTFNPDAQAAPAIGDLMFFRTNSVFLPREGDTVVWTSGDFMFVRIESPWDGRVRLAPPREP